MSFFFFQVQNLALHCASTPKAVAVKSELPDRKDAASFPLGQQQQQQQTFSQTAQQPQVQPQQQQMTKSNFTQQSSTNPITVKTGNQAAMTVPPAASVAPSSSSSALPLSQLLLSPSAAPVILVPTSNVPTSTQGYPIGSVAPKTNVNTQTLMVQPLQQASTNADKGPVPIQPKTAQGRLPVQLPPRHPPPILPAPPSNSQVIGSHNPPHIPVQVVGARQGLAGNAQAVALAHARNSTAQESPSGGNVGTVSNNSAMVRSYINML